MAFLKDLVDGDERLERLHLVGKNWLPVLAVNIARGPSGATAQSNQTQTRPTLSCLARTRPSSCGPTCRRCMLARVFLRRYMSIADIVRRCAARTLGRDLVDAGCFANVNGKLRLLPRHVC